MSKKLSLHANCYLLQRNAKRLVYHAAKLFAGLRCSYLTTVTILNNGCIPKNVLPADVEAILWMERGLRYIFIDRGPLDAHMVCKLNQFSAYDSIDPGSLARYPRRIHGVSFRPPRPSMRHLETLIGNFHTPSIYSTTDTGNAVRLMLALDRNQFFYNGNKRTAWLAANYWLFVNGRGILDLPQKSWPAWNRKLKYYYETDDSNEFVKWIINNGVIDHL